MQQLKILRIANRSSSNIRAEFGAAYNPSEHTHNNLSVTSEIYFCRSRIRDTDMADDLLPYQRYIVFRQANSMVAQANAVPQQILSLLQ